jgi:hypothetical protein
MSETIGEESMPVPDGWVDGGLMPGPEPGSAEEQQRQADRYAREFPDGFPETVVPDPKQE